MNCVTLSKAAAEVRSLNSLNNYEPIPYTWDYSSGDPEGRSFGYVADSTQKSIQAALDPQ